MAPERHPTQEHPGGIAGIVETTLLALAATALWYWCYYLVAPWIWSQNIPFRPEDITPWIRSSTTEHDGVEIYALYLVVFANIVTAFSFFVLAGRLPGGMAKRALLALSAIVSIVYCLKVGFIPPMNTLMDVPLPAVISQTLAILLVVAPLTGLLYYLQQRSLLAGTLLGAVLLVPACFLAVANFGWRDYTYIFAPALRLLNGAAPSDVYFQYDLLPSLLAAAWMKAGLDLNYFRVLGQAAYYLAMLGVFLLAGQLFVRKELAALLLIALILGRIYASPFDATLTFQTTPVRLDLWFPLLLTIYLRGPYHWATAAVCGLLLLLMKNFGIIYSAAYFQLLVTLWAIGYLDGERKAPFLRNLMAYGKRCAVPLAILGCCTIASHVLFRNAEYGNFTGYYRKIGIGFIQIAQNSFYWYVPVVFSVVAMLLFRLRSKVSPTYLTTGLFLLFCAIGNSIYFFGRSHEHNIINIAIVLLFLFFFMLDLVARFLNEGRADHTPLLVKQHGVTGVAVILIIVIIVSYSEHISKKGFIQIVNVANAKTTYSTLVLPQNFYGYMEKIREATNNSSKVFFADEADFTFYYFGGYAPVGYCNPFLTWIFTKDLKNYLQRLLDNGYYIVCSPTLTWLLEDLKYVSRNNVGETVVIGYQSNGAKP